MNNLSWFLYFIDILGNLQILIWLSVGFLAVAIVVAWIRGSIIRDDWHYNTEEWKKGYLMQWNSFKLLIPIGLLAFLGSIIPSSQTMYMVAASEIGERIVSLEEVKVLGGEVGGLASDTITLLREKIQEELKPVNSEN